MRAQLCGRLKSLNLEAEASSSKLGCSVAHGFAFFVSVLFYITIKPKKYVYKIFPRGHSTA